MNALKSLKFEHENCLIQEIELNRTECTESNRTGLNRAECIESDQTGLNWIELHRIESDRTESDQIELDRIESDRNGLNLILKSENCQCLEA